jgi:hypothetical protein
MTQEEKAKAYDEALERARALRQEAIDKEYAIDYVKDYEDIFPELAGSEDERVRRELIEFIRWSEDRGMTRHDFHQAKRPSKWIDYLEKQKELARRDEVITLDKLPPYDKGFQDGKAEAMADLERTVIGGDVDNISKWLAEELNKAFKKGQESSHEDYIRGYTNGYKDAQEEYNKSVAYHFPIMPTPPSGWGCDGTHCTNPHHDCINCPAQYSSGGTITTPNSASGTSTLKAE